MRFEKTDLADAWLIQLEPSFDDRGFFVRTFSVDEFRDRGLEIDFPQHSTSNSVHSGTIRGMHFQRSPHAEVKLVRCTKGTIWDVIIDIRPTSPTYRKWQGFELSDTNHRQLYIPKGFAHGFQTLTPGVEVSYLISERYAPDFADGLRYNDPSFIIPWPRTVTSISQKDLRWAAFAAEA